MEYRRSRPGASAAEGDPLWNEVNPLLFSFQTTNGVSTQQIIRRIPLRHTGAASARPHRA
jgi:hypothetical protein